MRQDYYGVVVEIPGLGPTTNRSTTVKVDTGFSFVIDSIQATVRNDDGANEPPFSFEPGPTAADNTAEWCEKIRVQIEVNSVPWFSNPVPITLLAGNGRQQHPMLTKPVIPPGADLKITAYHGDNGVQAAIVMFFEGHKLLP